ncbi:MAG: adenosine deaminase [Chloroflexi bacterium HGW-Chloroflexi-5]|jgi:adenosine deaminase|nr:MAG: adenosine deaminase [Chloroflexi bacterium HGW-Chloroflexi-5]
MVDTSLPLIDLHHHLDGSVRLETILDLGLKHNLPLPAKTLEELRPYVQVSDPQAGVMDFIEKFKWMVGVLVDYDTCRRVAFENVEDAASQGIDYIELRYSPWFMAEPHALNPQGVVEAVTDGIRAGEREFGVRVNQVGILSRHYGSEIAHQELSALLSFKNEITALDLAGDEGNYRGEWFVDHFSKAREAGWHITVHAGEIMGPQSIWQAIRELKAERIGHAVHAVEDAALIAYLAVHHIGVECCLTSNVQTSTVRDYQSHPLRTFLESGVLATLNTDDPGISAIDLNYEYEVAAPAAGLTVDQIKQAQKNALEIAFLSQDEKQGLIAKKQRS